MTDPQPSCPRCHLYLSARGCTPELCANPEGAAELERLRAAQARPSLTVAELWERLGAAEALLTGVRITHGPISHTNRAWREQMAKVGDYFGPCESCGQIENPDCRYAAHFAGSLKTGMRPSDLDVFRAMLERAGIPFVDHVLETAIVVSVKSGLAGAVTHFTPQGRLVGLRGALSGEEE